MIFEGGSNNGFYFSRISAFFGLIVLVKTA